MGVRQRKLSYVAAGQAAEEQPLIRLIGAKSSPNAANPAIAAGINQAPVFSVPTHHMDRVSTSSAGVQGNSDSGAFLTGGLDPHFSADGTKVVFLSAASNLVAGDTNNFIDVFVKDLAAGETTRVSVGPAGEQANEDSSRGTFSPDGSRVMFQSFADSLLPGDTVFVSTDIFIKTLATGELMRIPGRDAVFSPDGSKIAFASEAKLVAGDTNDHADIYVMTLATGVVERVSVTAAGAPNSHASLNPIFSPDGTKIAFVSHTRSSLVAWGSGEDSGLNIDDVYLKDLLTGAVTRVSSTSTGGQSTGTSEDPIFSPDGAKILFITEGRLLPDDPPFTLDIYMRDIATGELTRLAEGFDAAFSPDGRWLAFASRIPLDPAFPHAGGFAVYLRSMETGDTFLASVNDAGTLDVFVDGASRPEFSPDGTQLLFASTFANLVSGDTNGRSDIFVATIGNLPATFTENGAGVQMARYIELSDDGNNYGGGSLTIAITAGNAGGDALTLAPSNIVGSGLEVAGSVLTFNGVQVGTVSGNGPTLMIALNSAATDAIVEAIIYAARFQNSSEAPGGPTRSVTFTLVDGGGMGGGGLDSASFVRTVAVRSVNDAPSGTDKTIVFEENGNYVLTVADFGFSDVDGNSLLSVRIMSLPEAGTLRVGGNPVTAGMSIGVGAISNGLLRFVPEPDASGDDYALFFFQVTDNGGNANGGLSSDPTPNQITFDVTAAVDPALTGTPGDDVLSGTPGADEMHGLVGNDVYFVDHADDVVVEAAGEGSDQVYSSVSYVLTAGSSVEILGALAAASSVALNLSGNAEAQQIFGNAGANALTGGGGADALYGGLGDDTYFVEGDDFIGSEAANGGFDQVYSSTGISLSSGAAIEVLSVNDYASTNALTIIGNELAQQIFGNAGANILVSGGGQDALYGGLGDDIYLIDGDDHLVELAGGGFDQAYSSTGITLSAGAAIEVLSVNDYNSTNALTIIGNELAQQIFGNAGANILVGGGGQDALYGNGGDDIYLIDGDDFLTEAAGNGFDQAYSSTNITLTAGAAIEVLGASDSAATTALNLTGNTFGQHIVGNAGTNVLRGGGGADILQGLGGDDFLYVDNDDTVLEAAGGGHDTVLVSNYFLLNPGAHVEILRTIDNGGTAAITLWGNELSQTVIGNAGANQLNGGGGADVLQGLGGADVFAFGFNSALGGGNVDTILDFLSVDDHFFLDHNVFTGLAVGFIDGTRFVFGGSVALDADDRIIYNTATGELFFDADGNAAGAAVLFAVLSGAPAINSGDFQVI